MDILLSHPTAALLGKAAWVWLMFAIPRQYQHRALFWGILGVTVLRADAVAPARA